MSRKRTPEQSEAAQVRGEQARLDLENTTIVEAFRLVEHDAIAACRVAVTPEQAHHAAQKLQVVSEVLRTVQAFVSDGKSAAQEMAREIETQRERRAAKYEHAAYLTAAQRARSEFDHSVGATREDQTNA